MKIMGIESGDIKKIENEDDPFEPLFGRFKKDKNIGPYPPETVFRVFTGCLNDEADKLEYEDLLTKSFRCQNYLKNPGDLAMITLNGTFDKGGQYHVACRYAIIPEKN